MKCPRCGGNTSVLEYGHGWIAVCARCGSIVYNENEEPEEEGPDDEKKEG